MKTKNHLNISEQTSRRQFTKTVAAAFVVAPLTSSRANAQKPPATKQAPAPPNPQPAPATQKPSPVADAYAEVARVRFGEKLTPEELARVKRDIENNVQASERLRAFKLKNGDEPDFIFGA